MISRQLADAVRLRAGFTCEYCRMPQSVRRLRFPIDHIRAIQHRGPTILENLALCCGRCNRHKGPNLTGADPMTGEIVRLFNPRTDDWHAHFRWEAEYVVGITDIGRTTVEVLNMNHPEDLGVRRELIEDGKFPPDR